MYYNTYFNGQKAFHKAEKMRDKRLKKNPNDSAYVSPEERLKYERAIEKGSKIIELYPSKKEWQPKALFLIAESYLNLGEFAKAVQKYIELEKIYPKWEELPTVRFHRAKAYFLNGQFSFARPELEAVAEKSPNQDYRLEALALLAQLQFQQGNPQEALQHYEALLKQLGLTPLRKANIHFEIATLAYVVKQWSKARGHAQDENITLLPLLQRFQADTIAVISLYNLGKKKEAMAEIEILAKSNSYQGKASKLKLIQAAWLYNEGNSDKSAELWMEIPKLAPKTAEAAEAYFHLGEYQYDEKGDESKAKVYYDSSAAQGDFTFAREAKIRAAALVRMKALMDSAKADSLNPQMKNFMIAELFFFELDKVDSALFRLKKIVEDSVVDSLFTMRAAYARAFIENEFLEKKSDSLYAYVINRFPGTEYAKQAEKNLGRKVETETREDKAHQLFLSAEQLWFGGFDLNNNVIPAYETVIDSFAKTEAAAKAAFVRAKLMERLLELGDTTYRDSAKMAYKKIISDYPKSLYKPIAEGKLTAISEQDNKLKGKENVTPVLQDEEVLESDDGQSGTPEKKKKQEPDIKNQNKEKQDLEKQKDKEKDKSSPEEKMENYD